MLSDVVLQFEKQRLSVQFPVAKYSNPGLVRPVLISRLQLDEGSLLFASSNLLRWRIEVDSAAYQTGKSLRRTHRRSDW